MVKAHKVSQSSITPMPPFKTLAEEAAWWDSHSGYENLPDGTPAIAPDAPVTFHRAPKRDTTIGVRLTGDEATELRQLAERQGVGASTLLRMWAREHLRPQR
jgi:hypothetical protein